MVSGQWSVVSGQLSVVSGQLSVVSGQLSVVSCQLSVVSCQLSVVSCQENFSPTLPLPHFYLDGEEIGKVRLTLAGERMRDPSR
ncbi:hypothetical protein [Argonema antarcticum]|uniref:hypothetical protein n=1 Tax=Argonema antarcticum TaxID=2942763 RepID=UPI003B8486DF